MKFPRNARIFRGRLDAAPFASVLFLLVLFLTLASLTYTPGVPLELPPAFDLPGTDQPSLSVALDSSGSIYYQNKLIGERELTNRLRQAAAEYGEPPVLTIQADKAVRYEQIIRLSVLARDAGIRKALLATLPPPISPAGSSGRH